MPVYTVTADESGDERFRLHNEAVKIAAHALATVERFEEKGFSNIRVFRETNEITVVQLREDVVTEKTASQA